MVKCGICKGKVEETFLKKVVGTVVKDLDGKKHTVCASCQKGKIKPELLAALS